MHDLSITDPVDLESDINQIAGVVTVGLFARRPADVLLLGTADGVRRIDAITLPRAMDTGCGGRPAPC